MMGWIIVGGLALLALQRRAAPQPQPLGAVAVRRVNPVVKSPVPALPHGPVAQSFAGNEPVLPGKAVAPQFEIPTAVTGVNFDPQYLPSPVITRLADNSAGAGVAKNLQTAVQVDIAQGSYSGFGVPLAGGPSMFAPLQLDPSGEGFANWDALGGSGSIGFSGGALAG